VKRLIPLLLVGGCATVAPAPEPDTLVPVGHVAPEVAPPGLQKHGPGLRAVLASDPALEPLLAAARAASPDLETAAARVLQARAGLRAARAQLAPTIDASASATRRRQSQEQFGPDAPPGLVLPTLTFYEPGLVAGWEIDLFGRLAANRKAAAARLSAADADAQGVRLTLETDIARGLVAVRSLEGRIAAATEAVAAARKLDHLARVRAEAGLVTGLDSATTAADVAQAQAALPPLAADRAARVAALSRLTGLSIARVAETIGHGAPLPAPQWVIPDVPSDLLKRRPDIRAAAAQLTAADADVAAALAARYPRLTLTGSLGWLSTTIAGLFTGDALATTLGGTLSAPLLDFGRTAAEVDRSRAVVAEATALYRASVLRALAEVETELAAARGAQVQADELARAVGALETATRLSEAQYRGGLTDARTVSEASRRLADARDRWIISRAQAIDAALRLELATGGPLAPATGSS
jgi:NodT family efflux transporter outer membrane factor (OMF) lipoprotein